MSTIQTVIVEHITDGCEINDHAVFFLKEPPDVVKASIAFEVPDHSNVVDITREVYSLEEYLAMRSRPLSEFCTPKPKRGIWWLAISSDCVDSLINTAHQDGFVGVRRLNKVDHLHVTLAHDVTEEEKPAYRRAHGNTIELGSYLIDIKGVAYNSKCAALVVDIGGMECCNKHPHITLATAAGVPPVYSNDMLSGKDGAYSFLPLCAKLMGTLEFFEFQ